MAQHGCNYRTRSTTARTRSERKRSIGVGGQTERVRREVVSKSTSTYCYIGAGVATLIALVFAYTTGHSTAASTSVSALTGIAWGVAMIAGLVMLVAWIGALIRLGQLHSWGWFAAVLILQLIALGIIGMVAYAIAGPSDEIVVTRPTVTGG